MPNFEFELGDKTSKYLRDNLPPHIIGMREEVNGFFSMQYSLDAVSFPRPGIVSLLGLGEMPYNGQIPEGKTIKEVWITKEKDGWYLQIQAE